MNIKEIRRIIEKAINCFLNEQKFLTPGTKEADKFEEETFARLRGVDPFHKFDFGGGSSGEKPQTKTQDPGEEETAEMMRTDLEGEVTTIGNLQHNLTGKKKQMVGLLIEALKNLGITNEYIIIGTLAAAGKESGFKGVAEKSGYSFSGLKKNIDKKRANPEARARAVASRVWNIFKKQEFTITDDHIRAISGGGRNGYALFNIAYGYSSKQGDEKITIPVLVNGKINPKLYDPGLAGYKYRGRGMVQATFKKGYISFAKNAGLNVQEILENPSLVNTDPDTSARMSAGVIKANWRRMSGKMPDPGSIEEGVKWAVWSVGGPGFKYSRFNRSHEKAMGLIKKNFRLTPFAVS